MRLGQPALVPALLVALSASADVAHFESEPNDTPENYNRIKGAVTLYGSLAGRDQDGYFWTVSDDDARKLWTFELHGVPGAKLTQVDVVQLEYAENGVDLAGKHTLFAMGTRDGTRPSIHEGLMFEPGEYMLGVVKAGAASTDVDGEPGSYRFFIREQSLSVYRNPSAGASLGDAHPIRPGRGYTTFEPDENAWYSFDFSESDASRRWAISVQGPVGKTLKATLLDSGGGELISRRVDEKGKLSFRDLAPPAGIWYLHLEAKPPGMIQHIATEITGARVEGQEAEPNDERNQANVVDLRQPLAGRIGDGDSEDRFRIIVEESETLSLQTLRLESINPANLTFCLQSADWKDVQCRSGTPPLEMSDLLLPPGEWGLHLRRAKTQDYTITLNDQGSPDTGREIEPNDAVQYATGVAPSMRIKGRWAGDDTDYFQFLIAGEPQLWRFQVNGSGVHSIGYVDGRGKEKASVKGSKGQKRLRLDNVFLLPGRHSIRVRGADGDYTLLARALGPPVAPMEAEAAGPADVSADQVGPSKSAAMWNPDGEVEPNDKSNMQRLAVGQVRTGTLPDTEDEDHYRFFVANYDHLKLTIEPPEDGSVHPYLFWYGSQLGAADDRQPGEPIEFQGLLPPGDYSLVMSSKHPSDKPYRLSLQRLPRFSCSSDCEPSGMGNLDAVSPLPLDLRLQGVAQTWRDKDVYQLPAVDHDTLLLIRTAEPLDRAFLTDAYGTESSYLKYDGQLGGYRITLPANIPQRLAITGRGSRPYDAQLEFPRGEFSAVTGELSVESSIALESNTVGAFLDFGQRISGLLVVRNSGVETLDVTLDATTSDMRWSATLESDELSLEGGGQHSIPITVNVPSDAWADHVVRVSVRVRDREGRQVESWSDIGVDRASAAVNPYYHWPIPGALRGGFNAAWLPFGASWTEDVPEKVRQPRLRDDLVFPGTEMECCRYGKSGGEGFGTDWTLDLPGDDLLPVAGIALDAFGSNGPANSIRIARLFLSQDGSDFEEALAFEALPLLTEQQFALPTPISARFARLRVDSTHEYPARDVATGEWKVILQPGFDLSNGRGFNIADPALGGHLVWSMPPDSGAGRVLSEGDKSSWANLGKATSVEYVIGFKRDRAARIERVEWRFDASTTESERNFATVDVSVSEHSPIGPWRAVGAMQLSPSDTSATLSLNAGTWARFVRFEAHIDSEAKRSREPGTIEIWERPSGNDYLSILTEWGEAGGRAYYETQQEIPEATELVSNNDSRSRAAGLSFGERASGAVSLGRLQNWYRLAVPQDVNTLHFEVTGDPTVRTVLRLEDDAGNQLPAELKRSGRLPGRHGYEAIIAPGKEIWVNVSEPPRNVVFSWDTSGSVGAYIPRIYNSVMAFSGEVQPDYEWVNLLPFGMGMLLSDWSDEPMVLQTVLNDYRQENESSDAERSLYKATQALARRPGTKAVVLVTDAITPYYGQMWKPMAEIQPRVFGVGVGGSGIQEQNRFRDWAAVNGGDYRQLRYLGEMDVAFDRASTKMHRPAAYTLRVQGEFREAPGPGRLRVIAGDSQPQTAIELILDASGSMLQRMEGKRRITVAKEVLTEAVRRYIPAGTPMALRVFGHKEVDSCRTDLEIQLAPLDPEIAAKKIAGISAMNLARTPIADSLAAVEDDLKGVGSGAIVLVTDGEETCEGDPAAAIEALREKGFDVSLNIVGLAIEDEELAAQFESWAKSGGGRYFPASNQDGLSESIRKALNIPFVVYDQDGNQVAVGLVGGEPVELERGAYRVYVASSPPQTFEPVTLLGEDEVSLELEVR